MEDTTDYGLGPLQDKLLQVLRGFDALCRENAIAYSLHGGTLLGAERHHGFIPWDDDLDVSIRREDYRRLERAVGENAAVYGMEEVLWVPRFYLKELGREYFIDVFIWDYISDNPVGRFAKINLLRCLQGMIKTEIDYDGKKLPYRALMFLTHAAGLPFSREKKLRWYHTVEEKWFTGKHGTIHRSNDAFRWLTDLYDGRYMDRYTELDFAGTRVMATARYREGLVHSYGPDYMTPPPPDQRVSEHSRIRNALAGQDD